MTLGPWLQDGLGGDGPASGALAVLMDDVVGQAALSCMPSEMWAVTTELSLSFPAPLPAGGRVLAESEMLHVDSNGGAARGRAVHEDGSVVAAATVWLHAVTGVPAAGAAATGGEARRRAGLSAALGVLHEGGGRLTTEPSSWLENAQGVMHGGVLACLAEMSGRRAAPQEAVRGGPLGGRWRTSSVHVVYLRPATGPLTVVPELLHAGRSLASTRVRILGATGKAVAEASVLLRLTDDGLGAGGSGT